MKQIWTPEGRRFLRTSWILLAISVAASAAIIGTTHWFLQQEKRSGVLETRRLQQARARVEAVRRERDSLQDSGEVFKGLLARGLMQGERRLDMVELLNALRVSSQIASLDYEVAPQRPLSLAGSRSFTGIDLFASRVKLKLRALHEGDLLAFIDGLEQSHSGFYPIDRCLMKRTDAGTPDSLQPHVEADCTLEWITLKEKRGAG